MMLRVPLLLWISLIRQLRRRGAGVRESGAFLLGHRDRRVAKVVRYACYDDLDPAALESGAVVLHAIAYARLWEYCRDYCLDVLGDVHTHPGNDVRQSCIDRQNPTLPNAGHLALIVPRFGSMRAWSLREIGVYEYCGDYRWETTGGRAQIRLCAW
jgi:proteasome lid subunit RPN8/RPN11